MLGTNSSTYPMCPPSTLVPSNGLHNVHGIHIMPHAPPSCWRKLASMGISVRKLRRVQGNTLGVGGAQLCYHSSRGKLRRFLRWVGCTMIAATTGCLSPAIRHENPNVSTAASVLIPSCSTPEWSPQFAWGSWRYHLPKRHWKIQD
ncbi:hypothetical protein MLD38_004419 [Melastoma candidum]|uniref:Uncharacterized protein n=1 Tax=Melastoma candidum TaxID=119954 RepID=A0ACB9S5R2_9MYRT|nr:hypothetical protein MLD38_004419 [Melastoma candidum]